jgi:hypothetical protein
MHEALDVLAASRHPPGRDAPARLPVPGRWRSSSPRTKRCSWSSRTATRRCTACWSTSWSRPGAAGAGAALRRHADHRALHHPGHHPACPCRSRAQAKARGESGMTYIAKPRLHHPTLETNNKVGYTRRDYEGKISTLCAGCGHDSISAAIIQACWELDIEPHRVAKLSGIGCSSKTPDYFLGASRTASTPCTAACPVLTGANLANRDLLYLGVSGDGDSASIGLGQFAHAMRRGVRMVYIVENNGVYGLTKGQFSATADRAARARRAWSTTTARWTWWAGAAAGRHLCGAQLLGRQGAAGAADQGRHPPRRSGLHRRDQPLRGLQQPRRQHQELRLRARAQRGGEPHRLHHAAARGDRRLRAGRGDRRGAARWPHPAAAQAALRLRPHPVPSRSRRRFRCS